MPTTLEEAIEVIRQLPPPDREKVRDWIDGHDQNDLAPTETLSEANDKFRAALKWIDEHQDEFDGQFVVLDGDQLVANGTDAKTVYEQAKAKGYASPFLKRINVDTLPFGGW